MNEPVAPRLSVEVVKRVHAGLTINARLELGAERAVVFGPSGSGKSTLLRLIAGLDRPDDGRIVLDGRPLFDRSTKIDLPARSRKIGLIFQDERLFPHLCVAGNLRFGLARMSRRLADDRVNEVAELCGVADLLRRDPSMLSGGERQRVGLARTIAPRPRLLLCDEPVSALDLPGRYRLIERIKSVQEAEGIPLIYVTHSPGEALALGTSLFSWDAGTVVDVGKPIEVLARARLGEAFENVWTARLESTSEGESTIRLQDGPCLISTRLAVAIGSRLTVRVRADEIVLGKETNTLLSARNVLTGSVDRIYTRAGEAEVIVSTGGVQWVASVTAKAVESLELTPGTAVTLIVKARSLQVVPFDSPLLEKATL